MPVGGVGGAVDPQNRLCMGHIIIITTPIANAPTTIEREKKKTEKEQKEKTEKRIIIAERPCARAERGEGDAR